MLQPLQQWICDTCGELISEPGHGYVEWLRGGADYVRDAHEFRIVHHAPHSPSFSKGHDCYRHTNEPGRCDLPLENFVGHKGMVMLLRFLDVGPYHNFEYEGPSVADGAMRDFVQTMRRLHLPYYEEARLYWAEALSDGFFDGANEVWIYLPDTLKDLIERYSDGE